MPPDHSVDFDFTKRGLLVFADKSIAAGSVYTPCSSLEPKASTFTPNLGVNEFNQIIQQMAKVRLLGLVNQTYFPWMSEVFLPGFCSTFSNMLFCCVSGSVVPPGQSESRSAEDNFALWKIMQWFGVWVCYWFSFFAMFFFFLSTKGTNVDKELQLPENVLSTWWHLIENGHFLLKLILMERLVLSSTF